MEGTLVIPEKRGTIDKLRDFYNKHSDNLDNFIETRHNAVKLKNKVARIVFPIVFKCIPEVSFLAPLVPAMVKVSDFYYDSVNKLTVSLKEQLDGFFIKTNGEIQPVFIDVIQPENLDEQIELQEDNNEELLTSKGMRR